MRTLEFIVNGQKLQKKPECDFSGLVKGTRGYLNAAFIFGDGWEECGKIAVFYKCGKEYPVEIQTDRCMIPDSVLENGIFMISLVGIKENYRICTNKVEVRQYG